MLKHFAARLREHIRATDMAARIGEEFAVLLEAASIEDAQVWAERFRQDVATTAVVCGEVSISYSASMGWAPDVCLNSSEQVMQQADSALYQAKDKGATKLWAHKYFRIERNGDEGKATGPDQNISCPMGSDDVLRALRTGDRARAVRNHCRDHRGLAVAADLDRLQPAGHRCVQSARSQGLPDRVRHDHDAAHRHGV